MGSIGNANTVRLRQLSSGKESSLIQESVKTDSI